MAAAAGDDDTSPPELRLNVVCTGNICRSPTASVMLEAKLAAAGLGRRVEVVSCGIEGEAGMGADERTAAVARARGYARIDQHVAAQLQPAAHIAGCHLLLACDTGHLAHLQRVAGPHKVRLLCAYARGRFRGASMPDPWYGSGTDFEHVADMCEAATDGLVEAVAAALATADPAAALLAAAARDAGR